MKYLKSHVWNYLFGEPFRWLLYYFFQPDRFKREIEIKDFSIRIRFLMRLIIPMFLVSYPVALVLPIIYLQSNWISVLLITALGTMLGVTVGITWDILVKSP